MNEPNASVLTAPSAIDSATPSQAKALRVGEAYLQYCEQCDEGQNVNPEEYCAQYPSLQSTLGRLIQAHHFFQDHLEPAEEKRRAAWPVEGATFLGFRLVKELGKGAFARVFLANEIELGNRLVVVKIARRGGAAEAKILGSIQHPHVVPIHSIQQDPNSAFSVACMPYVGGATLHDVFDLLKENSPRKVNARVFLDASADLPTPVAAAKEAPRILQNGAYVEGVRYVGWKLALALAHIHQEGVCHLDLKPSNVLLEPNGEPVLLDFNLSSDARRDHHVAGGTLPYMSPEQLRNALHQGEVESVGPRSDVFSLGVLLYELATGAHPFGPIPLKMSTAELGKLIEERQARGFAPIRKLNPDVDGELAALIEKCLRMNPDERPQSAAEIASTLQRQLRPVAQMRRKVARHPIVVAACLLISIASITAAAAPIALAPPPSERHHALGVQAYRRGAYADAVLHFNAAITADENNHRAYFARGRAYHKLGEGDNTKFSLAITDFAHVKMMHPLGRSEAAIGFSLQSMKTMQGPALSSYQIAVEKGFVNSAVYNNMGLAANNSGKPDDAPKYLDDSIRIGATQVAHYNRGLIHSRNAKNLLSLLQSFPADKQKRDALTAAIEIGLVDFEVALTTRPLTTETVYNAACFYATASEVDVKWKKKSLELLQIAIVDYGHVPQPRDYMFKAFHNDKEYQELVKLKPAAVQRTYAIRTIDPIDDSDL